jgi:hypothetical protein
LAIDESPDDESLGKQLAPLRYLLAARERLQEPGRFCIVRASTICSERMSFFLQEDFGEV